MNSILYTPPGPPRPHPRRLLGSVPVAAGLWTLALGTAVIVLLGPGSLWPGLLILAAVNFRIFALLLDWFARRSHRADAAERSR